VLVVDDEKAVRSALRVNLGRAGFDVELTASAEEALERVATARPDLVLTDVKMPGMDGHALLDRLQAIDPDLPVVIMTGHGSVENAVLAMRAGAADYLIKPVRRDELVVVLERALHTRRLEVEVQSLRARLEQRDHYETLIGATPEMQRVYELIDAVAPSEALVLVTGPTGTGKELISHAIHSRSRRADGPFVVVNCAALPEGLLESELFGHEKGAFTGAVRRHEGRFEQADGGTLLLDEIGEVPLATQVRLLRVLESGELQRVGSRQSIHVDVRVVAATNRQLEDEVAAGRFRKDLFYRLNVFRIHVPALASRRADIPLLVDHFLRKHASRHGRPGRSVAPEALGMLMRHSWPGNVRELEHVIERALILCQGPTIEAAHLQGLAALSEAALAPPAEPAAPPASTGLVDALAALERRMIIAALEESGGVQAQAARALGISRSNLHYRIKKLDISLQGIQFG
jgi:DNA-binding NtrC family response regulator